MLRLDLPLLGEDYVHLETQIRLKQFPPLTLMLLALCYKNSGLFFNLKKNSQTRMVETRVTQAFISTHKASVAIRISALTCCISCHSRCLEASRPTRRGHLDSKLERRE